jgi:hypothetical protein
MEEVKPLMEMARALKGPATLCSFLLVLCVLAAYPFAEMGANDDFAYVRSAKILADTGHVTYVGWASAMLGWQLAWGALFIKAFTFSFTATRVSILLIAACTAFLLQRCFVGLGLYDRNATLATLTIVLSPLFIPLSFSFMSDIPSLFTIVLCLFCCLHAWQATKPRYATAWLVFAAVSNVILGTARQTGWVGVLVMVPSTLWLLRRRGLPMKQLVVFWIGCVGCTFYCLYWFRHQIYTTVETAPHIKWDQDQIFDIAVAGLRIVFGLSLFLLPVLIAYAVAIFKGNRRVLLLVSSAILLLLGYILLRPHSYSVGILLLPAVGQAGDYVTPVGILKLPDIGSPPVVLQTPVRIVITLISYFASASFLAFLFRMPRVKHPMSGVHGSLSWRQVGILLVPSILGYGAFLGLRVSSGSIFDRYLLPLLILLIFLVTRIYQERVSTRLPRVCFVFLIAFAAFGIAGTHDFFAMERARLAAIDELRAAGLPRDAYYGGFGYDGWTQIDRQGHIDTAGIVLPPGARQIKNRVITFKSCGYFMAKYFPAIHAQYALSYDEVSCDGPSQFAPVRYRLWLPPFASTIYIRKVNPVVVP